jgi:hypothetical protein
MSTPKIYREFIEKMEKNNYIRKNDGSTILDDSDPIFAKYIVKKDKKGKFLELVCPSDTIITICGRKMNCDNRYEFKMKCYDNDLNEPFKNPFISSLLVSEKTEEFPGIMINYQLVITKIGNKTIEVPSGWERMIETALKVIGSKKPNEYPLWSGAYEAIYNFGDNGLYLESGQKLVFYAINPEFDIRNIELIMEADIFEKIC